MVETDVGVKRQTLGQPVEIKIDPVVESEIAFYSFEYTACIAIAERGRKMIGIATQKITTVYLRLARTEQIVFGINQLERQQRRVQMRANAGRITPVVTARPSVEYEDTVGIHGGIDPVVDPEVDVTPRVKGVVPRIRT